VPRKIRGVAITEDDISETVRAFAQAAAEDGLVKLRDELPEVIISDLQMPRMAGIEFMSVVRRRFPSIPVICLSGLIPEEVGGASWAAVEFSRKGLEPPQD
jgi:CheY-like chemotaxis protein